MSARTLISHRMFVAALNHDTNGMARHPQPDRALNWPVCRAGADPGTPLQYRAQSPRAVAARRILSAAINSAF